MTHFLENIIVETNITFIIQYLEKIIENVWINFKCVSWKNYNVSKN